MRRSLVDLDEEAAVDSALADLLRGRGQDAGDSAGPRVLTYLRRGPADLGFLAPSWDGASVGGALMGPRYRPAKPSALRELNPRGALTNSCDGGGAAWALELGVGGGDGDRGVAVESSLGENGRAGDLRDRSSSLRALVDLVHGSAVGSALREPGEGVDESRSLLSQSPGSVPGRCLVNL